MKYKKLMFVNSILIFLCTFVWAGASSEIIGYYEKTGEKILYNNGINHFEIDTYKLTIGNDVLNEKFICVENLKTLGYSMKWDPEKRQTSFKRLKSPFKTPIIGSEDEYEDQFNKETIEDISKIISASGPIYKSDVKISIDDKEVKSYNMGGYSFVAVKELKRLGVDFLFEYGKVNSDFQQRVYKIVQDKIKYGLVTSDGVITVNPEYDKILIPEKYEGVIFVIKDKEYYIIDDNGEIIQKLNIPLDEYSYMSEEKNYIRITTYMNINDSRISYYAIFNSKGEKLFEGEYDKLKLLDNDYLYVRDDNNSYIYYLHDYNSEKILTLSKDVEVYYVDGEFVYFKKEILVTGEDGREYKTLSNSGIMDMKGNVLLEALEYKNIYPFRGNYAVVNLENNRYTFIDKNFNKTTIKDFKDITSIHDGIAVFLGDGEFTSRSTSQGLSGAVFGIIDKGGNVIVSPEYKMLKIYEDKLIRFAKIHIEKYTDEYGLLQIEEDFDNLRYGIMTLDEEVIIPQEFERIKRVDNEFYCLKDSTIYIYDINGKLISTKENLENVELEDEFYFIRFWDDKKSIGDYPLWRNDYDIYKLPKGIKSASNFSFQNDNSAYNIGFLKVYVTKEGLKIPTYTYSRGLPIPPPDYYFPTFLMKE